VNRTPVWTAVARVLCCLSASVTKSFDDVALLYLLLMSGISSIGEAARTQIRRPSTWYSRIANHAV